MERNFKELQWDQVIKCVNTDQIIEYDTGQLCAQWIFPRGVHITGEHYYRIHPILDDTYLT